MEPADPVSANLMWFAGLATVFVLGWWALRAVLWVVTAGRATEEQAMIVGIFCLFIGVPTAIVVSAMME